MKVGFTGSREEPTVDQIRVLSLVLRYLGATSVDHGDCDGSDEAAHFVALGLGLSIQIWPPESAKHRAFCMNGAKVNVPLPYNERNHEIVNGTDCLVGMPNSMHEKLHSGTWATLRYARKQNKTTYIIWPGGDVTKNWGRSAQKVTL